MKKLVLVLFIISAVVYAQKPKGTGQGQGPNHEKMKALKTAHITDQLDLTSAEAEKFWPIYNEFDAKLMELRNKQRGEFKGKLRDGAVNQLSDKEANEMIDKMLDMKTKELTYRKELVANLRGVIPPQKIIKLHRAEESFKRMLLKRLKNGNGQGQGKGNGSPKGKNYR